jgi:hypothetical protein
MALINCTINSREVSTPGGQALGSLASIVLKIKPDNGFVLQALDFTNNTGSVAGVTSITLANSTTPYADNNEVSVTVDLNNSFVPNADLNIIIDIDGAAILKKLVPKTINGTFDTVVSNATPASQTGVAYSVFGTQGSIVSLFTKTFTASSGKFFETPPSYVITTGLEETYIVTVTDTFTSDVYLTARTFTVKGVVPSETITGDNIDFVANASGTIEVPSTGKITAFRLNTSTMTFDRGVRKLVIYGDVGAQFRLSMVNEDSLSYNFTTSDFVNGVSFTGTIPSSGSILFDINIPAVTDNDLYSFTLSTVPFSGSQLAAAIDSNGDQVANFSISQIGDVTYTVKTDAATDSRTFTSDPQAVHIGQPFVEYDFVKTVTSTLLLTDNADMVLTRLPVAEDFTASNTNSASGTDSSIDITSVTVNPATLNASGNQLLSFTIVSTVDFFGSTASSHILDLGNFMAAESVGGASGFRIYTPTVSGAAGGYILGPARASYTVIGSPATPATKSIAYGVASGTNIVSGTGVIYGNFYGNSLSQITLTISAAAGSAFHQTTNLTISKSNIVGQAPAQDLHYNWTAQLDETIDANSDMTFNIAVTLANNP